MEFVNYEKQVNGIMLCVVGNKIRHNLINKNNQFFVRLVVLNPNFIFLSNITSQVTHIFVSPLSKVAVGTFEQVVKT